MRYLITALLAILATDAMAAEPSWSCTPEQRCVEEPGPTYDIGRGAKITLPSGWKFFSYPTAPDPIMVGLREIRAFKDGVVVAITPFPNIDRRTIAEDWVNGIHTKAVARYVAQSKEKAINMVSMSKGDIVGSYASFTATDANEKPFAVLPNRRYSSVTSFMISHKFIIFSISVASERLPDEAYVAAVDAIRNIQ